MRYNIFLFLIMIVFILTAVMILVMTNASYLRSLRPFRPGKGQGKGKGGPGGPAGAPKQQALPLKLGQQGDFFCL